VDQLWRRTHGPRPRKRARVPKGNKDIRDKLENVLRKKMEIPVPASRMRQRPDQMAMLLRHKGQSADEGFGGDCWRGRVQGATDSLKHSQIDYQFFRASAAADALFV